MSHRSAVNVTVTADDEKWYAQGLKRLRDSHANGHLPGLQFWTDYRVLGGPTHRQVPYGFKYTALKQTQERGYTTLLWMDASTWAVRSTAQLFEQIEEDGYWFEQAPPAFIGQWTSDACLEVFDMDRDTAMTLPVIAGTTFGLNLKHPVGKEIFEKMLYYMQDGISFHGAWINDGAVSKDSRCKGHRHDQSVLSILVHQMGLKFHTCPQGYLSWNARPTTPRQCIVYCRRA